MKGAMLRLLPLLLSFVTQCAFAAPEVAVYWGQVSFLSGLIEEKSIDTVYRTRPMRPFQQTNRDGNSHWRITVNRAVTISLTCPS